MLILGEIAEGRLGIRRTRKEKRSGNGGITTFPSVAPGPLSFAVPLSRRAFLIRVNLRYNILSEGKGGRVKEACRKEMLRRTHEDSPLSPTYLLAPLAVSSPSAP